MNLLPIWFLWVVLAIFTAWLVVARALDGDGRSTMKDAIVTITLVCMAILFATMWQRASAGERPPDTARDWVLAQAIQAQTIPEMPECYQARIRPGRYEVVCIGESEWRRQHAQELIEAHRDVEF